MDIKKIINKEFKSERIAVRITSSDKRLLESLAEHYDATMSDVLIALIRETYSKINEV